MQRETGISGLVCAETRILSPELPGPGPPNYPRGPAKRTRLIQPHHEPAAQLHDLALYGVEARESLHRIREVGNALAPNYNGHVDAGAVQERIRDFFLAAERGIAAVYIFGSAARGDHAAHSDVDVGILLQTAPPATLDGLCFDLEAGLARVLGGPVDLVVLNSAPVDLVHRVLRDGRLVLDRDPSARIRFEVKSRNDYFDLYPILAQYRRQRGTGR